MPAFCMLPAAYFVFIQPANKEHCVTGTISHANNEYSSMAIWNDEVILMPQYPAKYIYTLNKTDIGKYIAGFTTEVSISETLRFVYLYEVIANIQNYEGVEATTVIGNNIYFSIETTNPTDCYIAKGKIVPDDKGRNFIVMDTTRLLALEKPRTVKGEFIDNAGFESMIQDGHGNLIAFYEYNKADVQGGPYAYIFDTALNPSSLKKMPFSTPLPYRLTDAYFTGTNKAFAINYNWSGDADYHTPGEKVVCGSNTEEDVAKTCYSRVIELEIGSTITYKNVLETECSSEVQLKVKSLNCFNWEGMVPFENGVLLITDQYPGSFLSYYSFK